MQLRQRVHDRLQIWGNFRGMCGRTLSVLQPKPVKHLAQRFQLRQLPPPMPSDTQRSAWQGASITGLPLTNCAAPHEINARNSAPAWYQFLDRGRREVLLRAMSVHLGSLVPSARSCGSPGIWYRALICSLRRRSGWRVSRWRRGGRRFHRRRRSGWRFYRCRKGGWRFEHWRRGGRRGGGWRSGTCCFRRHGSFPSLQTYVKVELVVGIQEVLGFL